MEQASWWTGSHLPSDYAARLSAPLSRRASWSDEILLWGAEDGNRVDVYLEAGTVADVRVRVDLREPSPEIAEGLLAFARLCEAVFIDESGAVIEPTAAVFALALLHSRAARFLRDPELYLSRIGIGGLEDA